MCIDVDSETLIQFPDATTAFPGRKKIAVQTLHRWRLHGVRGAKLETILVGGLRFTSKEAIDRFIALQNHEPSTPALTPSQRQRQSEAARKELESMGV